MEWRYAIIVIDKLDKGVFLGRMEEYDWLL